MITRDKVSELIANMESDLIERTISTREEKLGPIACAYSNDFPNHKDSGYILLGVNDNGTLAGSTWTDDQLQSIGNIKTNGTNCIALLKHYRSLAPMVNGSSQAYFFIKAS